MKHIIIILMAIIVLSCKLQPDATVDTSTVSNTSDSYLTYSQYTALLDNLQAENNITKSTITSQLPGGYDYAYFQTGDYKDYSFLWSKWNDGWVYYISVDIWIVSGSLDRSMCSYYSD